MAWVVAQTSGSAGNSETVACFYLRKAGLRCFFAVEHVYYSDPRTKEERFKIRPKFQKYVFVEVKSDAERDAAREAVGVARLLGWVTDSGYKLATIPDHYVTDLMDAPIEEINRKKVAKKPKRGDKLRIAVKGIKDILAEFQDVDRAGKYVVSTQLLGGVPIHVPPEAVEIVE